VIEAVVERLDIKQALFARIAAAAPAHAILTSNTSGIAIGSIAEGLPEPPAPASSACTSSTRRAT
jgi:3-hydroxyacyl-CoA dehydrogenase